MTTIIKTGKPLHKENTFDIFNRINKMIIDHYYPYLYSYDSNRDIDILADNEKHNILYYYYKNNTDNTYNYDIIPGNLELYFEKINNLIKLSIINGQIILISNVDNNGEDEKKTLYFDNTEFNGIKHTIQIGNVKNKIFSIDNIDNNLILNINDLEESLINGKMNDNLINNNFNEDLFREILQLYKTNNNNFNLIKESYGYEIILNVINLQNINPINFNKLISLCINLNGEIYMNFIENKDTKILNVDIFNKKQTEDKILKDYFIIPSYDIIYNKYTDLKNIVYN